MKLSNSDQHVWARVYAETLAALYIAEWPRSPVERRDTARIEADLAIHFLHERKPSPKSGAGA